MSKAFLKESDFPELPELPPLVSPLPPGARNLLTAAGVQQLRDELTRLVENERPPLAANAQDFDAKRELQALDQRIRYLQESLRTAEIVRTPEGQGDVVRFGANVTVRDPHGEEVRYRLVGVDETDLERHWVSWLSPIARALLNARVGDRVAFKTRTGEKQLEVVALDYEGL